jgi:tetratricopeptide (TPR) repeat protein
MNWQPPDSFHLSAAQGWLELGNWREAGKDLERLAADLQRHPDVLRLRVEIHAQAKRWQESAEVADILAKLVPDDPFPRVRGAFALHELGRTLDAYNTVLPVADQFPDEWVIPYNLACYCAQLKRIDEAEQWLQRAISRDQEQVREAAMDDPDLKPLWKIERWQKWKRAD